MYISNKKETFHPVRGCIVKTKKSIRILFRNYAMLRPKLFIFCLVFAINVALPSAVLAANSLSRFGITWTFDRELSTDGAIGTYQYGLFANGDYWVVNPEAGSDNVTITNISPSWDGTHHGSMVNPVPIWPGMHGYDSRHGGFDSSLLVQAPIPLDANSSLISAVSWIIGEPGCPHEPDWPGVPRPMLKIAAVLTVLGEIPPDNGATVFRPPYSGSNKPIYSTSGLRKDLLTNLPLVGNTPDLTSLSDQESMERVWLDHFSHGSNGTQYTSPTYNMPGYGREYSQAVGKVSLLLLLDEQELVNRFGSNKDQLLTRFVQVGIDLYGVVENGGYWWSGGGLNHGRKWPILFAGLMLDHAGMKEIGERSPTMPYQGFQEDCQTFYVDETTFGPYTTADYGLPEWHTSHCYDPDHKAYKDWNADGYRCCCTANSWAGIVLSAHIMGVKDLWNHDALFDYQDRYMHVEAIDPGPYSGVGGFHRQTSRFAEEMWDTYRADFGCVWTPYDPTDMYSNGYNPCTSDTIPPLPPSNLDSTNRTESLISLAWTAPGPASDGDLASSYKIYRDGTLVDTVSNTSFQDTSLAEETSYNYEVNSVDDAGNQSTSAATGTFSTLADTTPPAILSVSVQNSVHILFNEPLDEDSATDPLNYDIKPNNVNEPDIIIYSATLDTDLKTVILITSDHTEDVEYTLTVDGVRDLAGNAAEGTTYTYQYNANLIGHWKFDEGSGTSATDSSGRGNTGILVNGPNWTTGKIDGALRFDGVDDAVQIGTDNLNVSGGTITFWIYPESFSSTGQFLFGHATQPWSNRIQLYTDDASGNLDLGLGDSHTRHTNIQDLNTNIWYHITLTWDGTNYVVYVDGGAKASGTYTGLPILETYADIGNNGYSSNRSEAFSGIIDDVRIYNRALNAAEVSELYDAGTIDPVTHTLVVTAVNGSVTKTPNKASYNHGEEVTLQPLPDTGYSFVNWSGDLTGSSNPATIIMDANKSVTANFTITVNTYTLNVTADNGSVTKTPDQASYDNGTTVTLQATANTGYSFAGWSGDASGTSNPTTVVMDGNKSVTANFTINTYTLGIIAINGSVAKTPDQASYNHGTTVTLQATANTGYSFANWSGDASGTSNPITVVMDGNKSVTANFTINTYTISASAGSNGQISPDGIMQVNYGASQTYTITPDSGYKISDVIVDGSSVGAVTSYSFTNVIANRTISASFAIDEVDVTAPTVTNLSPQADSIQVPLNTLITLDITDSGDGVDANTITIKVNGNVVYTGNTAKHSSTYGNCYRTGTKANYRFIYQSEQNFEYDQPISVDVKAMDLAGNPMETYSYSFKTEMRSFGKNKRVDPQALKKGRPATVCDSKGDIWAAWHAGVTGGRDIYVAKLLAEEEYFGDSIKITESTADQCNPVIAAGSDNKIYVAWQDNRRGNWDIYVSIYDGINWSAEIRVTDSNDNQINPAIVVDNSNNVHIVWEDDRHGNRDIYTAKSNNGFITTMIAQISSDSSDQFEPAIAADSDNTVYVVWTDTRSGGKNDIYGAASNNGPWTNIPIVTEEESQSSPAIATEAVGSILHLVWVDDRTTAGDDDIFYAKTDGGLPASPLAGSSIIDDTTGADQISPVIIATGSTGNDLKVFACWRDERNADADLYAVEIGTGAGTNVFVGDDGTNTDQSEPSIGIDGYGYPYLVWTDERTDICYAGSTFIKPDALASSNISTSSTVTVGTLPNSINSVDDVSAKVPQGAYLCDVKVTISPIKNPPKFSFDRFAGSYEFGPSGMDFIEPVTITIPYKVNGSENVSYKAYWYNSLTNTLSQQGITDVQTIVISPTLHALRFKATHFSPFVLGGMVVGLAGDGGGGGCSMSADNQASIVELLLPYIGLTAAMVILKLRDRRKRKISIT